VCDGDGVRGLWLIITFLFYEAKNHYSPSHLCVECLSSGTKGRGSTPNPHFFKSVDFKGGWGVLGPISTLFCPILFLLKNFFLFYPVFVGWKVIFRVKLKKNFFPQNVFPHFRGGEGGVREVWKKSTPPIFSFFEGFPKCV